MPRMTVAAVYTKMTAGTAATEAFTMNQKMVMKRMSKSVTETDKERSESSGKAPQWGQLAAVSLTLALHS